MLCDTDPSLAERIVMFLGKRPKSTAKQIEKEVHMYSIQAVYKALRQLQDEGVVLKEGMYFNLRLTWIHDILSYSDTIKKQYLESFTISSILPDENKKEIWHFYNLYSLNNFWSQLLLLLLEDAEKKVLLGWNPHPWFHLIQMEQEKRYIQALRSLQAKLYLIVGGRTYLDTWASQFWDTKTVEYAYSEEGVLGYKRSEYINVIGDYVVTVKLDTKTTKKIDSLYSAAFRLEDINLPAIIAMLNSDVRAAVWLEKKPEKAQKIRKQFKQFFGKEFL